MQGVPLIKAGDYGMTRNEFGEELYKLLVRYLKSQKAYIEEEEYGYEYHAASMKLEVDDLFLSNLCSCGKEPTNYCYECGEPLCKKCIAGTYDVTAALCRDCAKTSPE